MVTLKDLYTVYFLARANKRRKEDAVKFELNYEKRLADLLVAINERTYRANANYTFITDYPKPREVFACELESRIIQWYVVWRINPILEKVLTKRTFNNRVGMGTDAAVRCVSEDIKRVSHNYTRDAYVIQWDLKGYFPNAVCEIARAQLQKVMLDHYEGDDKDDLLWMIMIVCNALPQKHCYRKSPREAWCDIEKGKSLFDRPDGIGGAIGFYLWQVAMNLYLNFVDRWAVYDLGLYYARFVDDSANVVENKEAALALMPLFREKYKSVGCTMHPKKFYCQHYSKGVHLLGSYMKYGRIYLANRTIRKGLNRIAEFNKCRNPWRHSQEFLSSMNSYLGMMKNKTEFKNIQRFYDAIGKKWKKLYTMDWDNLKLVARQGYTYKDYLKYKTQ